MFYASKPTTRIVRHDIKRVVRRARVSLLVAMAMLQVLEDSEGAFFESYVGDVVRFGLELPLASFLELKKIRARTLRNDRRKAKRA